MNHYILNAKTDHTRHIRINRKFCYKHFMFAIDLLNMEDLKKFFPLIGVNSPGLYRFNFKDHYVLAQGGVEALEELIKKKFGYGLEKYQSVHLITNLKSMGYIFNPISIYLCKHIENNNYDYIYEVGNTFGEQKYYFSKKQQLNTSKNFYVSPFIEHNHQFLFSIKHNTNSINLSVQTQDLSQKPILTATMQGILKQIKIKEVLKSFLKHPFINYKVIFFIHLQAFILFMRKLPYYKKGQFPEHQINQHQLRS